MGPRIQDDSYDTRMATNRDTKVALFSLHTLQGMALSIELILEFGRIPAGVCAMSRTWVGGYDGSARTHGA
jgi:hypothetical protein